MERGKWTEGLWFILTIGDYSEIIFSVEESAKLYWLRKRVWKELLTEKPEGLESI